MSSIKVTAETNCPTCDEICFRPILFYENREANEQGEWVNEVFCTCECGAHFNLDRKAKDQIDLNIAKWHKKLKRHM